MLPHSARCQIQLRLRREGSTHSVDFPAPFGPMTAIRESRPTSILSPFSNILSGVYPNVTSLSCSTGGEILSASGNLNVSVSSSSGGVSSGSYCTASAVQYSVYAYTWTYFLQYFDLRLCLRCTVGIVPPTVNEGLQMLAVLYLRIVLLPEVTITLGLRGIELREVARNPSQNENDILREITSPLVVVETG